MTRSRVAALAIAVLVLGVSSFVALNQPPVINVRPGDSLSAALSKAEAGSKIVVAPGRYEGPVVVRRAVTIEGEPGVRVTGPADAEAAVRVLADGAIVRGIAVIGSETGISVEGADHVVLSDVSVSGSSMHGIEIVDASARVLGSSVTDLVGDHAQGIEIRNSDTHPDSVIEGSTVHGGIEGIVSHVSEVWIRGNVVTGTTLRGIAVTEMSDGWIQDNQVSSAVGTAYYCGDMSRCELSGNTATGISAGDGAASAAGWGLVVQYHASASSSRDRFEAEAGPTATFLGSKITDRSPLEPGSGSRALWPVLGACVLGLLVGALVFSIARRVVQRPLSSVRVLSASSGVVVVTVLVIGFLIQSFHMAEHMLQAFRVRFDGVPSRGGIVGPIVEAEWIHFVYNSAVLASLVGIAWARKRGWRPTGDLRTGDRFLVTAALIQSLHLVEHSAKVIQHTLTGTKVNPGFLGSQVDLVLLHLSMNLVVYLAFVAACVAYGSGLRFHLRSESLNQGELSGAETR